MCWWCVLVITALVEVREDDQLHVEKKKKKKSRESVLKEVTVLALTLWSENLCSGSRSSRKKVV